MCVFVCVEERERVRVKEQEEADNDKERREKINSLLDISKQTFFEEFFGKINKSFFPRHVPREKAAANETDVTFSNDSRQCGKR